MTDINDLALDGIDLAELAAELDALAVCRYEGCGKPAGTGRGWCPMHYTRVGKTGDPGPVEPSRRYRYDDGETCEYEGCTDEVYAREWCVKHYGRWLKNGDPGDAGRGGRVRRYDDGQPCEIRGCPAAVYCRGWCVAHYGRWRKYDDPTTLRARCDNEGCNKVAYEDGRFCRVHTLCIIEGCGESVYASGWCPGHYKWSRKTGDPNDRPAGRRHRNNGPCKADGCPKPSRTKGWCTGHYQRVKRYGDPMTHRPLGRSGPHLT
jgi:hypothetical protein